MKRRGLLIILSSPSGAGKSTLARRLRAWDPDIQFSVSATTRAARPGEVDGVDYKFIQEAEFKRMVTEDQMLEHAHVFGNFYGSPRGPVEGAINAGSHATVPVTCPTTPGFSSFTIHASACSALVARNVSVSCAAAVSTSSRRTRRRA